MEPVTHVLTGCVLARTGLNRKAAYATLAMGIGAEFPDIDTLWSLRGPVAGFVHHRGITHTFLGLPFEALAIVLALYGLHRWRGRRALPAPKVPLHWPQLYVFTLLALLSHLLLDFTNNYGVRPFFPFDKHWYAGSIVFIFDPALFCLLLGALILPGLLGLIQQEVSSRPAPLRARWPAAAALLLIAAYYGVRTFEHTQAMSLAQAQTLEQRPADVAGDPAEPATWLPARRSLVSPDPLSLFRWHAVTDFGASYQLAEIDTHLGALTPGLSQPHPDAADPAVQAALRSPLGRAYLDWSSMPWITVDRPDPLLTPNQPILVTLRDPRFLGDVILLQRSGRPPLTALLEISAHGQRLAQTLDGRTQP